MKVLIVDNGESYEDHAIYFVEVPERFRAAFDLALEAAGRGAKVVGTANQIEWSGGGFGGGDESVAIDSMYFVCYPDLESNPDAEEQAKPEWFTIPSAYRRRLIKLWERAEPGCKERVAMLKAAKPGAKEGE